MLYGIRPNLIFYDDIVKDCKMKTVKQRRLTLKEKLEAAKHEGMHDGYNNCYKDMEKSFERDKQKAHLEQLQAKQGAIKSMSEIAQANAKLAYSLMKIVEGK